MNGTIVNGKQLKKGDTAQLDNGCEVCFTPRTPLPKRDTVCGLLW